MRLDPNYSETSKIEEARNSHLIARIRGNLVGSPILPPKEHRRLYVYLGVLIATPPIKQRKKPNSIRGKRRWATSGSKTPSRNPHRKSKAAGRHPRADA